MTTLSKDQIDRIVQTHGAGMRRALEDGGGQRSGNRPPLYPNGGAPLSAPVRNLDETEWKIRLTLFRSCRPSGGERTSVGGWVTER